MLIGFGNNYINLSAIFQIREGLPRADPEGGAAELRPVHARRPAHALLRPQRERLQHNPGHLQVRSGPLMLCFILTIPGVQLWSIHCYVYPQLIKYESPSFIPELACCTSPTEAARSVRILPDKKFPVS